MANIMEIPGGSFQWNFNSLGQLMIGKILQHVIFHKDKNIIVKDQCKKSSSGDTELDHWLLHFEMISSAACIYGLLCKAR